MGFNIGLQLYSVRDELKKDFAGTLKRIKALGYDGVELAGLHGRSAQEVRSLCQAAGLVPISAHVSFIDMMAYYDLPRIFKEIGCEYIVIPYLREEYRPGTPGFDEVIEGARAIGERVNALGMKLAYHNHHFEFDKIGDEYALDYLYRSVPSRLLQTELDTCWVNVGGENPVDYINKYAGRGDLLHLKDFAGLRTEKTFALRNTDIKSAGRFELRPVGYGLQDMPSVIEAAGNCGVKWLIVEQDNPSLGKTPLECAEMSINYLKEHIG